MTSSTSCATGSEWSADSLYTGWGDDVTDEQAEALGDLVVSRFEELCAEAGDPSIAWIPRMSQVLYECVGESRNGGHWSDAVYQMNEDTDLDELREQAQQEVWDAGCGYDTPMSARVREVWNRRMTVTEAATEYNLARSSLTWAIRTGQLAAERNGRAWVVWSNDVEDWNAARPGRGHSR